ncbi:hypothetical protein BU14_0192s0001 [Porphyra umbilicalis]|uniref:Acid phosphatase n=1 Tax=Porphyra umbilicalis TaxID=2786 RepID=A0A1X6P6B5_PORUM|nr:hypothetical protein BU14_0192s0001 [Porphyra umbilicalis]|eukprot:OSX76384.1 hypothetical protein BU14_0192s0001 [Porphyra umbilicalis]
MACVDAATAVPVSDSPLLTKVEPRHAPQYAAHVAPPAPPPACDPTGNPTCAKERTTFLVDFDDCLFPTSALASGAGGVLNSLRLGAAPAVLPPGLAAALASLDVAAVRALTHSVAAAREGAVVIVTNSALGWVNAATTALMPRLAEYIAAARIPVVSARHAYGAHFPKDVGRWKVHAFHDQLRRLYPSWRGANVLALGDGMADLTSATDACASMSNCYVKGVKFLGAPSVAQLDRQLGVFVENLPVLVDYAASFRVCMAAS